MPDLEISVVTEQLVTCGDKYVISIKRDSAQTAVCAATFEIDAAGIPVDMLFAGLILEIDRENAAVAFALLAAANDGCRDEFG